VAILLAALNLLYIKPRLDRTYDQPESAAAAATVRRFRRIVTAEGFVALLILLSAGFLSDIQRAADAPPLADAPGRLVLSQEVEDLAVTLTIEPALVGQNAFDVYLEGADGSPISDAEEVSLRFIFLGQALGADSGNAEPHGDGRYRLEGSFISLAGPWQVEVAIRRPGVFDTFAPFRLDAAIGGSIRSAETGPGALERVARLMTLGGGLATGALLVVLAIGWGFVAVRAANRDWQLVPLLLVSIFLFWLGATQLFTFFDEEFTPARFLNNPILPDAISIATGEALYEQYCVACHGPAGFGDGPGAASLTTPPANFGSGHTDTHPDGDLYYWIRNGIENTEMPAFGDELSSEETWHLVNYVRRLSALAGQQQVSEFGNQ
jgi:mono/diheme cytochrome c family protein